MAPTPSHCPECEEALAAGRDPPKGHPSTGEEPEEGESGVLSGSGHPWSYGSDVT